MLFVKAYLLFMEKLNDRCGKKPPSLWAHCPPSAQSQVHQE